MYCPKCGMMNPDDSGFCSKCGNPFAETGIPEKTKKKSRLPWILLGLFLLLIAGCGAIFFLFGSLFSGNIVPYPKDTLNIQEASLEVLSVDIATGDVRIRYDIPIKNTGEKNLDKVILKDFDKPADVIMQDSELVIDGLASGEVKEVSFIVIVKKGGFIKAQQSWTVDFKIRAEIGGSYLEQNGFYYTITLTP